MAFSGGVSRRDCGLFGVGILLSVEENVCVKIDRKMIDAERLVFVWIDGFLCARI